MKVFVHRPESFVLCLYIVYFDLCSEQNTSIRDKKLINVTEKCRLIKYKAADTAIKNRLSRPLILTKDYTLSINITQWDNIYLLKSFIRNATNVKFNSHCSIVFQNIYSKNSSNYHPYREEMFRLIFDYNTYIHK